MSGSLSVSVVIRTKNSAATIETALQSLREQTVPCEIVIVDSGSTDGTLEIARRSADRLVEISPWQFSFGGALNRGARAASGAVQVALSSHVAAPSPGWLERIVDHYKDPKVAGTSGTPWQPDGTPLLDPVRLSLQTLREYPEWGFSNTASSWRASILERFPFNERMLACEDKEWSWRVLEAGWDVVIDPRLAVTDHHRRRAGTRALMDRTRRERRELAARVALPPFPLRVALRTWWTDFPANGTHPALFYRLDYLRMAELAGRWLGEVEGRRLRGRV